MAIIGGGLSGLAAAHFLRARTAAAIVLFDAAPRVGGKVLTQDIGGIPVEAGPDGFLVDPGLVALCRELGLEADLVEATTTQAYIWGEDGLKPLAPAEMRHTATGGEAPTRFMALRGGLETLITALERETPEVEIRRGAAVTGLRAASGGRLSLDVAGAGPSPVEADAVILAIPAPRAARLLQDIRPEAAEALAGYPYLDLGVVTLLYPGKPWDLTGSGFLARERPGRVMSGCTWLSAKWPHIMAHPDVTLMRATAGGSGNRGWTEMDDGALVAAIHRELTEVLGPAPSPGQARVVRWPEAIPDHRFRDPDKLRVAREALAGLPLWLAAGAYTGGGMASCVADAARAAEAAAPRLELRHVRA